MAGLLSDGFGPKSMSEEGTADYGPSRRLILKIIGENINIDGIQRYQNVHLKENLMGSEYIREIKVETSIVKVLPKLWDLKSLTEANYYKSSRTDIFGWSYDVVQAIHGHRLKRAHF